MALKFSLISFVDPQVLWGLFAVLVPVIIHLLNLRRVKKVEFSNVSFLKQIKEESSAKRKPVELLILLSRILGLALLVIAFAQPLLKRDQSNLSLDDKVYIYLDNSLSQLAQSSNGTSQFEVFIDDVNGIVASYPEGTEFHFIENSYANSISAAFTNESLTELLTEVQLVGVDRDISEVFGRISVDGLNGDIFLLTDFQGKQGFEPLIKDTANTYYIVNSHSDDISNVFVDSVYLENTIIAGDIANQLGIRFKRNFRDAFVSNVKLYVDNELYGTAEVDFKDQLFAEHIFNLNSIRPESAKLRVELDDPTLTYDNRFYLSINRLDKVKVVEVFDSSSPGFIQSLFEDNEVFQYDRLDSRFLDNEIIRAADFLIINEVKNISNQLVNAAAMKSQSGGSILVVPDIENSEDDFLKLGIKGNNETGDRMSLAQLDFENPMFQGVFEDQNEDLEMPESIISFRIGNSELDYLQYLNGRSYLSKISSSANLFFFAAPLNLEYSSFSNHALFVPVMYKLALGSKSNLSNLYYYTDSETLIYPIDNTSKSSIYKLMSGDDIITPDQRVEGDQLILEVPKSELTVGHYTLVQDETEIGVLSFNVPKSESDLKSIDPEFFDRLNGYEHIQVIESVERNDVAEFLQAAVSGIPLWKYALLGALIFLFVEIILIRYL